MKTMKQFAYVLATGTLLIGIGCGPKESDPSTNQTPPPPTNTSKPAEVKSTNAPTPSPVVSNTPAVTTPPPTAPVSTPPTPPTPTNAAITPANPQAQAVLDNATLLLSQNKPVEAFNSLTQLANLSISPEQKGLLTNLQIKASKMIAEAAKTNLIQTTANQASSQAQTIIDNATKLVNESKFAEALVVLNTIAQQTLTTNQLKVVETLKAQIKEQVKKAMSDKATDEASKALNSLLPK